MLSEYKYHGIKSLAIQYKLEHDDFFEARDKFLRDIEEFYDKEYGVNFIIVPLDDVARGSEPAWSFRHIIAQIKDKLI